MPVHVHADIRKATQEEFAQIAYDAMEYVFEVHDELGRFCDEAIYRDEVARRIPAARKEVPIDVWFGDFQARYFLDLLIDSAAVFELKTVSALAAQHRAQLLNYLFLAELPHGKLVNLRPNLVEHEFVNTSLTYADRVSFEVCDRDWMSDDLSRRLRQWFEDLLRDLGTGLDLNLYENALTHFLGGAERVVRDVELRIAGRPIGKQSMRLAAPGVALKVTALPDQELPPFDCHATRLLDHADLTAIHRINITRDCVQFSTLTRTSSP